MPATEPTDAARSETRTRVSGRFELGALRWAWLLPALFALAGCGTAESEDSTAVRQKSCPAPPVLPKRIDFGVNGGVGDAAQGDVDGDGLDDLAMLVAQDGELRLQVRFADCENTFSETWEQTLDTNFHRNGLRDTNETVAVGRWSGRGGQDVFTAHGVLISNGSRQPVFESHVSEPGSALAVARLGNGQQGDFLRAAPLAGGTYALERCSESGCERIGGPFVFDDHSIDIVTFDYDRDGEPDVLGGTYNPIAARSSVLLSSDGFATPVELPGVEAVDLEAGDIDGDGFDDLVAQVGETFPDFPSYTDIYLNRPEGLVKTQRLVNYGNHNDASELVDVDGDGCLDYLQSDVDSEAIGLRRGVRKDGRCAFLGPHDPTKPADQGWEEAIPFETDFAGSLGVLALDANADGRQELLIRLGWGRDTHGYLAFVQLP